MKVVMLTTKTCGKCRAMKPVLTDICSSEGIELEILDAMTEGREIATEYNVRSVPFTIFYNDDGSVRKSVFGPLNAKEINGIIN